MTIAQEKASLLIEYVHFEPSQHAEYASARRF